MGEDLGGTYVVHNKCIALNITLHEEQMQYVKSVKY
jgi:hypothetical protein